MLNAYEGGDMPHVDAAFNTDFATDPVHYKVVTNADGGTVTYIVVPPTTIRFCRCCIRGWTLVVIRWHWRS